MHTPFGRALRAFLASVDAQFDVCVIDTNPNPAIRLIAALASADFVLSPIQLNQEAMDGVHGLLNHDRVGVRKIKAVLSPKLQLIGLLPTMVEPTPFQKTNLVQVIQRFRKTVHTGPKTRLCVLNSVQHCTNARSSACSSRPGPRPA